MAHPFEYVDRYGDAGAPRPDPATMCKGPCEGTGVYPVKVYPLNVADRLSDHERREVDRIDRESGRPADGWYFVRCETCGGSGRASAGGDA